MDRIEYLKLASQIHFKVKQTILKKVFSDLNIKLADLRDFIHTEITNELSKLTNIVEKNLAFPIGLSGDSIVAHYTPTKISDKLQTYLPYYLNPSTPIRYFNIIKIDYGIHLDGNIIDKAFSVNIHETELESVLIKASNEAVESMKSTIGADVRLNELAATSREIVESYEYDGAKIKIVENVYSHNILPWKIHGDKFIKPDYRKFDENLKVESGEQYALEIYASNGEGYGKLVENPLVHSHYRLSKENSPIYSKDECNKLISHIRTSRKLLPFCPNMCNVKVSKKKLSHSKIISTCQHLQSLNEMESYPPIIEADGNSRVSQIEENVIILDDESKLYL